MNGCAQILVNNQQRVMLGMFIISRLIMMLLFGKAQILTLEPSSKQSSINIRFIFSGQPTGSQQQPMNLIKTGTSSLYRCVTWPCSQRRHKGENLHIHHKVQQSETRSVCLCVYKTPQRKRMAAYLFDVNTETGGFTPRYLAVNILHVVSVTAGRDHHPHIKHCCFHGARFLFLQLCGWKTDPDTLETEMFFKRARAELFCQGGRIFLFFFFFFASTHTWTIYGASRFLLWVLTEGLVRRLPAAAVSIVERSTWCSTVSSLFQV